MSDSPSCLISFFQKASELASISYNSKAFKAQLEGALEQGELGVKLPRKVSKKLFECIAVAVKEATPLNADNESARSSLRSSPSTAARRASSGDGGKTVASPASTPKTEWYHTPFKQGSASSGKKAAGSADAKNDWYQRQRERTNTVSGPMVMANGALPGDLGAPTNDVVNERRHDPKDEFNDLKADWGVEILRTDKNMQKFYVEKMEAAQRKEIANLQQLMHEMVTLAERFDGTAKQIHLEDVMWEQLSGVLNKYLLLMQTHCQRIAELRFASGGAPIGGDSLQHGSGGDDLVLDAGDDGESVSVVAGTLNALVERLTYQNAVGSAYVDAFFFTFHSFATPSALLDALIDRFVNVDTSEYKASLTHFVQLKKRTVWRRVYTMLKKWIDEHPRDFHEPAMQQRLVEFIDAHMREVMPTPAVGLKSHYTRRVAESKAACGEVLEARDTAAMVPLDPLDQLAARFDASFAIRMQQFTAQFRVLNFSVEEIASALMRIDLQALVSIPMKEFLGKRWSRTAAKVEEDDMADMTVRVSALVAEEKQAARHISSMIEHFNRLSAWVGTCILREDELKSRVAVLEHLILIAKHCEGLHNYNSLMAIVSGLNCSSVARLKDTWAKVRPKVRTTLRELESAMSSERNYALYRQRLRMLAPPFVPFLGLCLSDLTFIEDGNDDELVVGERRLIHFAKFRMVYDVVETVMRVRQHVLGTDAAVETSMDIDEMSKLVVKALRAGGTAAMESVGADGDGGDGDLELRTYLLTRLEIMSEKVMYETSLQREARKTAGSESKTSSPGLLARRRHSKAAAAAAATTTALGGAGAELPIVASGAGVSNTSHSSTSSTATRQSSSASLHDSGERPSFLMEDGTPRPTSTRGSGNNAASSLGVGAAVGVGTDYEGSMAAVPSPVEQTGGSQPGSTVADSVSEDTEELPDWYRARMGINK